MLAVDRRNSILEKLKATGSVTVSELSETFGVREETIRRDLTRLQSEGLLEKTYGGAYLRDGMHREVRFSVRNVAYVKEKERMGRRVAESVEDGETIFLDASTTALHVGLALMDKRNLVVITNGLNTAYRLAVAPGIQVITTGGTLRRHTLTNVGRAAEETIVSYVADKFVFSCDGIDRTHGITDANEQEAEVRTAMLRHARRRILVADHTKFDRTAFVRIGSFEDIDTVVTDRPFSEEWVAFFRSNNIEFLSCVDAAEA